MPSTLDEARRRSRPSASPHIAKADIKRVWGLARALGIDDSMVYAILFEQTGSDSLSRISARQGKALVAHLAALLERHERSERRQQKAAGVETLAHWKRSPDQDALIQDLLGKINAAAPRIDLERLSNRMFRKPFASLNRRQAQSLIEALKSIANRG
jgi:hypothetical protein